VSRIEQSGRMSLRRPKPPIKGGSAPEEEEEEEEEEDCYKNAPSMFIKLQMYSPNINILRLKSHVQLILEHPPARRRRGTVCCLKERREFYLLIVFCSRT